MNKGAFQILVFEVFFTFLLFFGCKENITEPEVLGPPWVVFSRSNSPLVDDHINWITSDTEGRIWLATDSGASSFLSGSWGTITDSLGSTSTGATRVTSITSRSDGSVWFGLFGGGVMRFNRNAPAHVWQRYTQSDGLAFNLVSGITTELEGEVWTAHPVAGISRFIQSVTDPFQGQWIVYNSQNSNFPSNQFITAAHNVNENSVWFGAVLGFVAIASYNDVTANVEWRILNLPNNPRINSIAFDRSNTVWFGKDIGASSLNTSTTIWTDYTPATTNGVMPNGPVGAVATDLSSTRWFGTNEGLVQLRDTAWTKFTRSTSLLPSDTISTLYYDQRKGNLWIGTPFGVAVYNENGTRGVIAR
ncbi:MAG: hypothetical protein HY707_01265 [Ignavibacteriae bacterium]|nr:hypothetical protein [Ignavibacteriota bacterium]